MNGDEQGIVGQKTGADKAGLSHWFARYGWIVLPGAALLVAYAISLI